MDNVNVTKFEKLFDEILNFDYSQVAQNLICTDFKGDEVDLVNTQKDQLLYMRLNGRNMQYLKKIKHAKEKLKDGTFGFCEECDADINLKRLEARPTATLCINCQEEKERNERGLINKRRDLKEQKFKSNDDSVLPFEGKAKAFKSVKDISFESVIEM